MLIDAVNAAQSAVVAQYSTPSLYTYARNRENLTWSVKTDDFFPYGISAHAYRTGFYTSRPALKRHVRVMSHLLQAARQLEVIAEGDGSGTRKLWEAMGVVQHHDAVSGTERQHVAYNYAYLLAKGAAPAYQTATNALAALSTTTGTPLPLTVCPQRNVSLCPPTQSGQLLAVLVYNSQSRAVNRTVRLPSNSSAVRLFDHTGAPMPTSMYQLWPTQRTQATPAGAGTTDVWVQVQIPAMGFTTFFYQAVPSSTASPSHRHGRGHVMHVQQAPLEQRWTLVFNNDSGLLESVIDNRSRRPYTLQQEWMYYRSMQQEGSQASGAYIFRPAEQMAHPAATVVTTSFYSNSSLVTEVQQRISDWISQTIRLSSTSDAIEFEWTVGPIDVSDGQGKEVITRFTTDIANNQTWYTDANAREFQTRIRNTRQTYAWNATEPTAGNFYPVTSSVWMADSTQALVLSVDRSEGASSLVDGQLELMLHRRTLRSDDGNTVEALNETDAIEPDGRRIGRGLVVTGSFLLSIVPPADAAMTARTGHLTQYAPPIPFFTPISSVPSYLSTHTAQWSFLAASLPPQLELITMQALPDGRVLFRLAHMYGVGEDAALSAPASVNVLRLFTRGVAEVAELSLSGNSAAGSHVPLQWNTQEEGVRVQATARRPVKETFDGVTVTLQAAEVRTFAIRFAAH